MELGEVEIWYVGLRGLGYGGPRLTLGQNQSDFFFDFFFGPTTTTSLPHIIIPPSSDNLMPRGGPRGGGRPSKGLQYYKKEILHQIYDQRWKYQEVVSWLADNKDLVVDCRTLRRYLKKWDVSQQDRTEDTEELRQRIRVLFCRAGASDEEMLRWLRLDGFTITPRGLVRIRKELLL